MIMLTKLLNDGTLWLSSGTDRVYPFPVPYIKSTHFFASITSLPYSYPYIPCSDSSTYGYWVPLHYLLCAGGGVLRLIPALALGNDVTLPPPSLLLTLSFFPFLSLLVRSEDVRLDFD